MHYLKYYFAEEIMPFMLDPSINLLEAGNLDSLLDILGNKSIPHTVYSGCLGMMVKLVKTNAVDLRSAGLMCKQIERVRDKAGPASQINKRLAGEKLAHLYRLLWRAMIRCQSSNTHVLETRSFKDFHDFITNSRFLVISAPKLRERLMAEVAPQAFPKPGYLQPHKVEEYLKDWIEKLEAPVAEPHANGARALATDHIVYVLNSLSDEEAHARIFLTTEKVLASRPVDGLERSCWTAALRVWASCLVRSDHFIRAETNDVRCREIVELLAPHVKPVALAFYLNRLDPHDGARLLLQTWVKHRILNSALRRKDFPVEAMNLHEYRGRSGMQGHSPNVNQLLAVHNPHPRHQAALDATFRSQQAKSSARGESTGEHYFDLISTKCEEYFSRHPSTLQPHSILPYMDLIAAVSHTGLSYRRLMAELFHLFLRFHRPIAPAEGIHAAHQTHGIRTLWGLAAHLINHYTAHDPIEALHIFRIMRSLPLRTLRRDFLTHIAADGLVPPRRIRQLLTAPRRELSTALRVDLLHEVAEACARSEHVRPLVAARFVYYVFQELREAGAPMDARLSRAFVHAAVIRALQVGDWVGTIRFRKVLEAVRWIEGEAAANKLDALVWKWRGKVLWERRYAYRGVGDVEAFERRREKVEEGFERKKLARERALIEGSGRGGDGDLDPYRFWKSVPEGEEVKNMRLCYVW